MPKALTLESGQRFGRLTVTGATRLSQDARIVFEVKCDCGETRWLRAVALKVGNSTSCGCFHREQLSLRGATHRQTKTPEYEIWSTAKARCFRKTSRDYKDYGGRGISMCEEWRDSFKAFIRDIGKRPSPELTLDRINNDGNYEPGNVRWATRLVQSNNQRPKRSRIYGDR